MASVKYPHGVLNLLLFCCLFGGSSFAFSFHHGIGLPTSSSRPRGSFMISLSGESTSSAGTSPSDDKRQEEVTNVEKRKVGIASDAFLREYYNSDIDDINLPPSLSIIRRSIAQLAQGSDIRGRFVHNAPQTFPQRRLRSWASLAHDIGQSAIPALTPFSAHCLGFAFATMVKQENVGSDALDNDKGITICIGRDPREHGIELADAFSRGAGGVPNVKVVYTGIATTPSLFEFCRSSLCEGGVMVTASHLPGDRNGLKFFTARNGGFQKAHIQRMIGLAQEHAQVWFNMGIIPPTSGSNAVFCNEFVHWMPHYEAQLQKALLQQVQGVSSSSGDRQSRPLGGLKIVLNAGNGSGGFFQKVLQSLGANVDGSIHLTPDPTFPQGIPNPEYPSMIEETIRACEMAHADLGILLDTDADRCGMVAPRKYKLLDATDSDGEKEYIPTDFEPLNRNRLIALMGVIYSRQAPGCAIVTDSVTSNGLTTFLENDLGLTHIRYLRGYANVIQKAQSLNEQSLANAEVAIETSGHCAVRENDFLDDGTFTAVKVLGLLAQERMKESDEFSSPSDGPKSLLDLIANLEELDEVVEFRLPVLNGSLESVRGLFDFVTLEVEAMCDDHDEWTVDQDNLEGIRVSTGEGGFFLLRKSLHDPVVCLQVEAQSKEAASESVVQPLLQMFRSESRIAQTLDSSELEQY